MNGLKFMCKVEKYTFSELADMLSVPKQNISAWANGSRNIPKKHLAKLYEIFGEIPEEYFQKDLDEIDQMRIKKILIENKKEEIEYSYTEVDEVTGEEIEKQGLFIDTSNDWYIESLEYDIGRKEFINTLSKNLKIQYRDNEEHEESISRAYNYLNIFQEFSRIVESGISLDIIKDVLCGIKKYQGERVYENELVRDVFKSIKKASDTYEKKKIEDIKFLIENGFYTKEELNELLNDKTE